jgi:hypothetical protein
MNAGAAEACLSLAAAVAFAATSCGAAPPLPRTVDCPTADGAVVHAQDYASEEAGNAGILLAPGAIFDAGSWQPLAQALAARGARVLAIDYRSGTRSEAAAERSRTLGLDVLAGVACLRRAGARQVSLVGASLGAIAVSSAAADPEVGAVAQLALLSPPDLVAPERLPGRKLVIFSADESLALRVRALYTRLAPPKDLVALPGRAHAQHIFATPQGEALTQNLLAFLVPLRTNPGQDEGRAPFGALPANRLPETPRVLPDDGPGAHSFAKTPSGGALASPDRTPIESPP